MTSLADHKLTLSTPAKDKHVRILAGGSQYPVFVHRDDFIKSVSIQSGMVCVVWTLWKTWLNQQGIVEIILYENQQLEYRQDYAWVSPEDVERELVSQVNIVVEKGET